MGLINWLGEAHTRFLRYIHSHPATTISSLAVGGAVFFVVGCGLMDYLLPPDNVDFNTKKMTMEEARLAAMVENARKSSWKENLDNALQAQDQFMLPGQFEKPEFMDKIEKRGLEIMKSQHDRIERQEEEKRKETTKFWQS